MVYQANVSMKYLSLFSGIGGFEKGIQQAYDNRRLLQNTTSEILPNNSSNTESRQTGVTCIGFSEIDKYAIQTYQKHYPTHYNYGDITKINADELPDFDLLVGGFPCQAFSIAGKRKGFEDTRGTLFFEIARILKAKQPRLFLLENVKGLLSHDNGNTFRTIVSTLNELGYDLQWQMLNSKNHGVLQNRERVFIIGHLRGTSRPEVFPFTKSTGNDIEVVGELSSETWTKRNESTRRVYGIDGVAPTIPTAQGGGVMAKIVIPRNRRTEFVESDISSTLTSHYRGAPDGDGRPGLKLAKAVLSPDRTEKRQNGRRMKEYGEPSFILTSQDRHGVFNGDSIRRLTPTECERLQGFPDGWTIGSDTQRYKQCGNAVTVNVIKDIMVKLVHN